MIPNRINSLSEPLLHECEQKDEDRDANNLLTSQLNPLDGSSNLHSSGHEKNSTSRPCLHTTHSSMYLEYELNSSCSTLNHTVDPINHLFQLENHGMCQTALHTATEDQLVEPLLPSSEDNENSSTVSNIQDIIEKEKSRNITPILIYTFIVFAARSLWNQSVIAAYVYLLKSDDPKFVGLLTGVMGMTQLFSSFPAGYLADKYRRDFVLKVGSAIGFIAAFCTFIAARSESFILLGCALSIWGLFWGICNTSTTALFADSIPDGERSYWFTRRSMVRSLGGSCGPIMALAMFLKLGNDWTKSQCASVICIGQCLCVPGLVLLCFMNDDFCINHEDNSTPDTEAETNHDTNHGYDDRDDQSDIEEQHDYAEVTHEEEEQTESANENIMPSEEVVMDQGLFCIPSERVIPVLVASSDVLGGLAAGMSIRYFPIFFLDNLRLTPVHVQVIFIVSTLCMTCMTRLSQWVGTNLGRIQTTLLFKWSGIFLLFAMVTLFNNGASPLHICILFVIRFSVMNAPGALTRSVLMDNVPKHERAKWSALESVTMFSWAGSAALGGLLVNWNGILFNFIFTAWFQLFSTIPLLLVSGRVSKENSPLV
jgi:predicted MFS family arabinose efflux permease